MPGTIFCPHCGVQNEDDDLFCVSCGKKLLAPNIEVQYTPNTSTQKHQKDTQKNGLILDKVVANDKATETAKHKSRRFNVRKIILTLLLVYVLVIGVFFAGFVSTNNLSMLKTAMDFSIVAPIIIPEQYQLVSERAAMEKEDSVGVLIYYKDNDNDGSIMYRETRLLEPGNHRITPPEYYGTKKFQLKSEDRVSVDQNGHATPNILHFYYSNDY